MYIMKSWIWMLSQDGEPVKPTSFVFSLFLSGPAAMFLITVEEKKQAAPLQGVKRQREQGVETNVF